MEGWAQGEVDVEFFAIVADLAGGPTELITPGGEVAWTRSTRLYGQPVGPAATAGCPLGQVHDEDTGWIYNLHRYYDPDIGRYATPDPVGITGGVNTA
ncbi:RHS repeat-associated core domain-containing protein [Austwickia chelonae]|uniref:RHS repeat-associated core domain-containing protein n=1 Tax=Austwickia chelonae TaxID=100225 RepID=UPI001FDEC77E|nr:RHS repeat-associated core domain-containing protein [Austwickia chelonae]